MLSTNIVETAQQWDEIMSVLEGHPMQSWQWGELKSKTGPWTAHHIEVREGDKLVGAAQILVRTLPFPFRELCYVPRGPIVSDNSYLPAVADAVAAWCAQNTKAVAVKIDPAVESAHLSRSWKPSPHVLLSTTGIMNLDMSEDEVMRSIHSKKARQYIRKAGRDGVTCRPARKEDLPEILAIYHDTARADGFAIHDDEFYSEAFDTLQGVSQLFVAEVEDRIVAFLWNVTTVDTAFELWGAVNDEGKRMRANFLLKWTAIKAAMDKGTHIYDLNGLLNDGISDFKLLFTGGQTQWIGSYDYALNPLTGLWNTAMRVRSRYNTRNNAQKQINE
ncbi:peptidoglycan bridge formation glycyltransferase FemA/FemB family protein [Alloscardovia theropitheci]|uniref:Peptidoglycan bridge formation glycyltransferase FemA/FemB family protein n=1 Tax=Alloscardovia theropitheci TaxID=2496842 RepID=A0A4R0QTE3_9BIFI|nr:peptidoglycan bridge formation glycyltransferase FemA/FemB family protein [Alloscardovia theropitheci]TCD54525.1 peptidoglycan bridge formation glycyltransferase FemA/FemB family protein [Alloscardovia theropitheci]